MTITSHYDLPRIARDMQGWIVGHTIYYHEQVASTMPLAHALHTASSCPSGAVVVAEEQITGRGRMQRKWETPFGTALLTSTLLCRKHIPSPINQLSMWSGIATLRAIAQVEPTLADRLVLKWPNDVLIQNVPAQKGSPTLERPTDDRYRKVAGILLETSFQQGVPERAVLGIGINVNQKPEQLPTVGGHALQPTSLRIQTNRLVDRTDLLIALCQQLGNLITQYTTQDPEEQANRIYDEWRNMLHTLGQQVTVYPAASMTNAPADAALSELAQPFVGTAVDITPDGSLIIENEAGVRQTFAAGDISIRYGQKM